jgi:hypothetical protein
LKEKNAQEQDSDLVSYKRLFIEMKTKKIIILLVFFICALNSYAQFIPVTTTIPTPQGNIPYTYYVGVPRYNYGVKGPISTKHKFTIELMNDSLFTARTKINIGEGDDFLKVKINKEEKIIKPAETKSISRISELGNKLVGIPADSCWLFKVQSGKINMYSFLAEETLTYVIAMQIGDGPIMPIKKETKEILEPIMNDRPRLLKLLEKEEFIRAIELYNEK